MIPVVVEGSVPDTMPGTGKGTEKNCCCGSYDPETYAFFLQYAVFPVCFLRRRRRAEPGFISAVTADARPSMIQLLER